MNPRNSARLAKPPAFAAPQLATLVERPPQGKEWLHEIKFDGYRMLCRRDGDDVRFISRNNNDWTDRFPALVAAARKLKAKGFIIDGEVVVPDAKGVSSFARMQDAMARKSDTDALYYVFDLLFLDGEDLRPRPLPERKRALARLLPRGQSAGRIRFSEHFAEEGAKVLARACALGLEGIISKRAAAPYTAGRGFDWQKSKCLALQEFVIVGYWERKNAANDFGALMLGAHERGKLVYTGNVGTGWTDAVRRQLYPRLARLDTTKPTVTLPKGISTKGLHWLKPKLVAQIAFTSWTNDGIVRHPSFQGLREDKRASEVAIERPATDPGLKGGDWGRRRRPA